jgi:hypothetical protein
LHAHGDRRQGPADGANIVRRELGLPEAHIAATDKNLSMVPLTQ